MTAHGLQMRRELTFDAWVDVGLRISDFSRASAWCLGDWLVYGQRTYGRRYRAALDCTSFDYQTLRNYAWVARRVEMSRRRDTLSFQHHAEVAALPEPQQELWLGRAERLQWSRNQLRRQLADARAAGTDAIAHPLAVVQVRVLGERERRWRQAAQTADRAFDEWLAQALDVAADAVLIEDGAASDPG